MTDPNWHLETPRLYISHPQPALDAHCDLIVALYNSPPFVEHCSGGRPSSINTREAARAHIAVRFAEWYARNGYGQYMVSLKPPVPTSSSTDETPAGSESDTLPADAPFAEKLARCKPIGTVSLMRGNSPTAHTLPDLGFAILPSEMRRGYAREASLALVEYALSKDGKGLGLDAVLGFTDVGNEAACAVFRSVGFEDRGARAVVEFGGDVCAVWVSPGAAADLSVYNVSPEA